MKTILITSVLAFGVASPAFADLTIKQSSNGKGLGLSGQATGVAYIKGHKMRSDVVDGDKTQSVVFDLDAQKMYVFDSKKKEADVWDMAAFTAELAKTVDTSKAKASLTPNGQTKQIAGQEASGYTVDISMPATLGGNAEMAMTVNMSGPVWIVKNAPGTSDYVGFYKAAAEKGWIFTDPRAAKGSPGPAKAMTELYKQIVDIGGIAYETDTQIKMSGSGNNPLGGLLARMGNVSISTAVSSTETTALADDLFAPPAGYKLNPKK
jgi:hypothetical protein